MIILTAKDVLPDDGTSGTLVGRIWLPQAGGPAVVVAASMSVPPFTATPAPVSKPVPPHVKASRIFFPVGCRWSTKAS